MRQRCRRGHSRALGLFSREQEEKGILKNRSSAATVVIGILDASGEVVDEAVYADLCLLGSSHTSCSEAVTTEEVIISGLLLQP